MKLSFVLFLFFMCSGAAAQNYPQNYFRNPLSIPMQLVANFGELRTNHWHMGLDIRTNQRENLPVYAAAEGYISAISIDASGFGRAIYINHPNGYTTLYAHLNNFEPRLHAWVKEQQYRLQRWATRIEVPADMFPVKKGSFIAYSGNTGGSQGPHVHFEIRDTQTGNVLNPLLFGFPIRDAVPPSLMRLALYDRTKSIYAQTPRLIGLQKKGSNYTLVGGLLRTGSPKISFALGAVDRFSGVPNPNGIYSASITVDGELQSAFTLDNINYGVTRYLNAHIDYKYKAGGGAYLQHLSKMPGENSGVYTPTESNGVITLTDDAIHEVVIEINDAAGNTSKLVFDLQWDDTFFKSPYVPATEQLLPRQTNAFERADFALYTTAQAVYDTVNIEHQIINTPAPNAVSAAYRFLSGAIPVHDSVTVQLKTNGVLAGAEDKIVVVNTIGTKKTVVKGKWQNGWVTARFRQLGTYQAFIDMVPPVINAVNTNLTRATQLVLLPTDNFNAIKTVRAEVDGQWLLLTNDKGRAFIYQFDKYFTPGNRLLKVTVEDVAGNVTVKEWNVVR